MKINQLTDIVLCGGYITLLDKYGQELSQRYFVDDFSLKVVSGKRIIFNTKEISFNNVKLINIDKADIHYLGVTFGDDQTEKCTTMIKLSESITVFNTDSVTICDLNIPVS